jgi:hypothetical protein
MWRWSYQAEIYCFLEGAENEGGEIGVCPWFYGNVA